MRGLFLYRQFKLIHISYYNIIYFFIEKIFIFLNTIFQQKSLYNYFCDIPMPNI